MTRRRLKLQSEKAVEMRLVAVPADLGREVRVKPRNISGRCWWVIVTDISATGHAVEVAPRPKPIPVEPVPAKRQNRGFGRRRWVLTAEVVTWKRKAGS